MATQISTQTTVSLTRVTLARIGYSDICSLKEDPSAFFYESGMMIDADGAYRAYHPDNKSGLDYLGNGGKPGNWWALVTDNGDPSGNPVIQGPNDPAPGFYISTTSLEDQTKNKKDPTRYVDSSSISYIVLPGRFRFGASLSDFCMVYNTESGKFNGGVFADAGPSDKIGEASIAMADALGISSSPKNGGKVNGIVYLVFPHSSIGWPLTDADIQQHANDLFNRWGGLDKLKAVMPEAFQ